MTVEVKSREQYVAAISGLFINKNSPNGITRAELDILCTIHKELSNGEIDRDVRITLANQMNMKLQVLVNYVNKLKKKGAITSKNRLHPIFFQTNVEIVWKD